jgi:hypothetical protein
MALEEIMVATTFAESWKPFMKSKNSATPMMAIPAIGIFNLPPALP